MARINKTGINWKSGDSEEKVWLKIYNKDYRKRNPEVRKKTQKNWQLKALYGLSPEGYQELLNIQDNRCALCQEIKQLSVDHNHETGVVRGLLCQMCNTAIGMFKENKEVIKKSLEYLR